MLQPAKVVWPSGPRRTLQARVRKGVGSNPTATIFLLFCSVMRVLRRNISWPRYSNPVGAVTVMASMIPTTPTDSDRAESWQISFSGAFGSECMLFENFAHARRDVSSHL